jgi:tether containing UBX domain for GLUT4
MISVGLFSDTAPPKCVLKDQSKTLIEAKLVPASVIYFGTNSKKGEFLLDTNN